MGQEIDTGISAALKLAKIGFYRYLFDGTILAMDQTTFDFYELEGIVDDPESVIGHNIEDIFKYIGPKGSLRAEIREKGSVVGLEYNFRTLKGSEKWGVHNSQLLIDEKTGKEAVQVCFYDITAIKKLELYLREMNARYQTLLSTIPHGIVEIDSSGNVVYINESFSTITGYQGADIVGTNLTRLFIQDALYEKVKLEISLMMKGERQESISADLKLLSAEGKTVDVDVDWSKKISIKKENEGYILVITDVTERKQAERKIKESEERFRSLVENTSDFIWETNAQGNYTYISPKVHDILGYEPTEIIGKSPFDFMDADEAKHVESQFQNAVVNRSAIHSLENSNRHKNGRTVILETSGVPILDADGTYKGYRGIDRDITTRKAIENKLVESEKKLRLTLDATPFPIAVVDVADDVIQYWSQSALQLFGHTAPTASQWYEIAYPDPAYRQEVVDSWKPFLEIAQKTGQPVNTGEYRVTCKDGSERICELYATFLPKNLIVTFNDITDRKKIEQELDEYRQHLEALVEKRTLALEAKNRELETFTYSVSHDLKAPLRGIDGYSRLLVEDYSDKLDDEGVTFLTNVRKSTKQMHQLIEDLLAYSRMERRGIHTAEIELASMIDLLTSERQHDIDTHHVKVDVRIPFESIMADADTMRQVVGNYLDNAIKFSKHVNQPMVEINGRESDTAWTLWVKDNGLGIDPQYHDRIFEIFQRLQRSEDYPGTGVGLAIVRKAVERIGGRVWTESDIGKGATFFVEIPKPDTNIDREAVQYESL